jgi:hypothetical protein
LKNQVKVFPKEFDEKWKPYLSKPNLSTKAKTHSNSTLLPYLFWQKFGGFLKVSPFCKE